MHKLGVFITTSGLILVIVGLAVGFWKMFGHSDTALFWLSLIPFGFLGLLLGITLTLTSKR
jgi:hypothetical protein